MGARCAWGRLVTPASRSVPLDHLRRLGVGRVEGVRHQQGIVPGFRRPAEGVRGHAERLGVAGIDLLEGPQYVADGPGVLGERHPLLVGNGQL